MNEALVLNERNAVLEVTFNRAEKYNAISDAMLEALHKAVGRFERRPDLRVMLIRAEGKYFSSGADLNPDAVPDFGGSTLDGRAWYRQKFHTLFDEIESIEKPLVVAHQGPCLGGALELSLSCDFRLAAASAHYALPEIKIGAMPSSGGVSRLTRIVGPHWTRWLVMTGERVTAQQAVQMGIRTRCSRIVCRFSAHASRDSLTKRWDWPNSRSNSPQTSTARRRGTRSALPIASCSPATRIDDGLKLLSIAK
jgi:enoyl-CoA hydratase